MYEVSQIGTYGNQYADKTNEYVEHFDGKHAMARRFEWLVMSMRRFLNQIGKRMTTMPVDERMSSFDRTEIQIHQQQRLMH